MDCFGQKSIVIKEFLVTKTFFHYLELFSTSARKKEPLSDYEQCLMKAIIRDMTYFFKKNLSDIGYFIKIDDLSVK